MIIWLDHKIFGSGRGMKSPFHDDSFYWLSGELYKFCFGFGAQLTSIQWTHPRAGERRRLLNREFTPLHSHRRWFRVRVAWCMVKSGRIEIEDIRAIKTDLDKI